jgi:DNA-directed RNA polymerase specialized sigma24 family protein
LHASSDWGHDRDGLAIDFYGETIDPILVRKVRRARTSPPANVEPVLLGMLSFLRQTIGLTAKQTAAFVMAEGYGASESHIATALGVSQQTVNEHLANARSRCRQWRERKSLTTKLARAA